jgi:mono/diheme cytochrome c family protein
MRAVARSVFGGIAVILLMTGSPSGLIASDEPAKPDPNDLALTARGKVVYAEQCASCHGASLEGQPN